MSYTPIYTIEARATNGGLIHLFGPGMILQKIGWALRVRLVSVPGSRGAVDVSDGAMDNDALVIAGTMREGIDGSPLLSAISGMRADLQNITDYNVIIDGTTVPVLKCTGVVAGMVFGTAATEANVTCTFITDPSR